MKIEIKKANENWRDCLGHSRSNPEVRDLLDRFPNVNKIVLHYDDCKLKFTRS